MVEILGGFNFRGVTVYGPTPFVRIHISVTGHLVYGSPVAVEYH